jgi:hypothetical protein
MSGTVTVPLRSLTESFTTIGKMFEAAHAGGADREAELLAVPHWLNRSATARLWMLASAAPKNMMQVTAKAERRIRRTLGRSRWRLRCRRAIPRTLPLAADLATGGQGRFARYRCRAEQPLRRRSCEGRGETRYA